MITFDDLNASHLSSVFQNNAIQNECRVEHTLDVKNKVIRADLDYSIFDKILSSKNCQSTKKPCEEIITIDGQKYLYIRFYSGTYKFDKPYTLDNSLTGMIVEGDSSTKTILDARNQKFFGIAFYIPSKDTSVNSKYLYMRNLTLIGGYNGFANKKNKIPKKFTTADREKWQKAIWVYGANSHAFVNNVKISGFYYGLTAEENGDAVAENLNVSNSGDGGFFSYFGGKLYVCLSESSYAADVSRKIGFGFVAESLHYLRTDKKGIAQCKGGNPHNPDRWDDVNFIHCVINASRNFSENERSYIFARNVLSHDNLFGGFLANMGAKINVSHSTAFNQYSKTAAQIEKLKIQDLRRPNVYKPGEFGAGHGIVSRLSSTITANNNKVFNNLIGLNAYWSGMIDSTGSDVWNNSYFAFHSVLDSFINASSTRSFGKFQLISYAVDDSSGVQVDNSIAFDSDVLSKYHGDDKFCEQFEDPCLHEKYLTPLKNISTRDIIKLIETNPKLGIFYYIDIAHPHVLYSHRIRKCFNGFCVTGIPKLADSLMMSTNKYKRIYLTTYLRIRS